MKCVNKIFSLIIFLLMPSISASNSFLCTIKQRNVLRDAPSTSSRRIKVLPKFTPLKVINRTSNWYEVEGYTYSGYIHASIVSDRIKCMTVLDSTDSYCTTKRKKFKRPIFYRESFKIIKTEIACNYVQGKWGRTAWLSSLEIWPPDNAKLLEIDM